MIETRADDHALRRFLQYFLIMSLPQHLFSLQFVLNPTSKISFLTQISWRHSSTENLWIRFPVSLRRKIEDSTVPQGYCYTFGPNY